MVRVRTARAAQKLGCGWDLSLKTRFLERLEAPSFELATPISAGYELKTLGFQVCQPLDQRTEVLDRSNS